MIYFFASLFADGLDATSYGPTAVVLGAVGNVGVLGYWFLFRYPQSMKEQADVFKEMLKASHDNQEKLIETFKDEMKYEREQCDKHNERVMNAIAQMDERHRRSQGV